MGRNVHTAQPWTPREDALVRRHYPRLGGQETHDRYLPGRSVVALQCRANFLGVQLSKRTLARVRRQVRPHQIYNPPPEVVAAHCLQIRRAQGLPDPGQEDLT